VKTRRSVLPAMLLAIALWGCKQPTGPAFSPNGQTLAFSKNGALFLRSGGTDRKISDSVEGSVVWSGDGKRLAFAADKGTTIYAPDAKKATRLPGVLPPYAWQGDHLLGTGQVKKDNTSSITVVDAVSGQPIYSVDVPFSPSAILPIFGGDSLVWSGFQAYRFNGLAAQPLPELKGYGSLGSRNGGPEVLLEKVFAKPHTHRLLVGLYTWNSIVGGPPRALATLDLGASGHFEGAVISWGIEGASADWNRLVTLGVGLALKPADLNRLNGIIDRYDLYNQLDKKITMSRADDLFMKSFWKKGTMSTSILIGSIQGNWQLIRRQTEQRGAFVNPFTTDLSRSGDKLAISTEKETQIYRLGPP